MEPAEKKERKRQRFLKRRVKCWRRHPAKGQFITQNCRSCLRAFSIANSDIRNARYIGTVTTLPVAASLEECRGCQPGARMMAEYEKRYGFYPHEIESFAPIKSQIYQARELERLSTPDTDIHMKAVLGIPN
jgi:hypothetical protein